ncbi:hypothetical protein BaRGS_00019842 [Batillaria attramentaria]|uniref:Uncharacterized protein n=1 Tax=Batillaria attramentaria TaxID=370345 RepID=A0ABD0KPB9_9CAEN
MNKASTTHPAAASIALPTGGDTDKGRALRQLSVAGSPYKYEHSHNPADEEINTGSHGILGLDLERALKSTVYSTEG